MIRLVYISSATRLMSQQDLVELLEQARARNLRQHITGLLLYKNATFVQALEGEQKDVHEIYEAILKDDRNSGNVVLREEPISERSFADWSMAFANLDELSDQQLAGYIDLGKEGFTRDYLEKNRHKTMVLIEKFAATL